MVNNSSRRRLYLFIDFILIPVFGIMMISDHVAGYYVESLLADEEAIRVESVKVNIFTGSLGAKNIVFDFPATSNTRISGKVAVARFTGLSALQIISGEPLDIGKIHLVQPQLQVRVTGAVTADTLQKEKGWLEKKLRLVNKLIVEDGMMDYFSDEGDSLSIEKMNLDCIRILPGYGRIPNKKFITDFILRTGACRYTLKGKLYAVTAHAINFSSNDSSMKVDTFRLVPLYSKQEFDDKAGDQTDRIDMLIAEINMVFKYGLPLVQTDSSIQGVLIINEGNINLYRDKRMPRIPGKFKKTVQDYLAEADRRIIIDSLLINRLNILYEEHDEDAKKSGKVKFTELNAVLKNIVTGQNDSGSVTLNANSGFMQSAEIKTDITFPYGQKYFDCRGTLSGLPLEELNILSAPNGNIVFSSGTITRMDFNFRGAADSAKGDMQLQYNNLDFAIGDKNTGDTTSLKSKVISFVTSDILIANKNKTSDGKPVQGTIAYARDRERFIFNYIFKSLLSGIMSTVSPLGNGKGKEGGSKRGKR